MIVKIQRGQSASGEVLIYNESNSLWWQGIPDNDTNAWMGSRQKVYAHAHIDGTVIVIDREAKEQAW